MNGLKPELKTIVMTKEPKNVEELRHCALLAEKAVSSWSVNTLNQTVLDEIQSLKEQLKICKCSTGEPSSKSSNDKSKSILFTKFSKSILFTSKTPL